VSSALLMFSRVPSLLFFRLWSNFQRMRRLVTLLALSLLFPEYSLTHSPDLFAPWLWSPCCAYIIRSCVQFNVYWSETHEEE
jgi:hypothetical protein